ncbi:MAG: very short patch repair endonuclease [Nonlabens sp.]
MSKPYDITEEPIKVPKFSEEAGFYTTKQRSRQMSKIRGKDTKPEIMLRKALWAAGYRYRKDFKKLIGKPDIAMSIYKTVVFVDGVFWHGYDWENRKNKIKSNREFWIPKIERNMQRDREVNYKLSLMGYTVMRFWSREVEKELERVISEIVFHLESVEKK